MSTRSRKIVRKTTTRRATRKATPSSVKNSPKIPEKEEIEEKYTWENFKRDYQILYPNNPTLQYDSSIFGKGIHWGQRKLALTVLQFLILYWDSEIRPEIIYAGAAPGININFLIDLFPETVWHLYDPRKITDVEASQNVKIYDGENGWFTDEIAEEWGKAVSEGTKVLFISDIRSADTSKVSEESERAVWKDMLNQQRWVQLIKPEAAHLKFRLPYPGYNFDDEIDVKSGEVPYLAGVVYLQPWPKPTSAEGRLVVTPDKDGNYPIHYWDIARHESQMYYHNIVTRSEQKYYNPVKEIEKGEKARKTPLAAPELLNNWDSLMEYSIFNDYLITRNADNRHEKIVVLSDILSERISLKITGVEMLSLSKLRKDPTIIKRGVGAQTRKRRVTRRTTRKR